jgi:hypothetical protein
MIGQIYLSFQTLVKVMNFTSVLETVMITITIKESTWKNLALFFLKYTDRMRVTPLHFAAQ